MQVAQPALAALGQAHRLAVRGQVGHHLAAIDVGEHGAHRHADDEVFAALAVALCAAPVLAFLRLEDAGEAKFDQGIDVAVGHRDHAAAATAVAAIRPALGNVFLAAERSAAVTALAGR